MRLYERNLTEISLAKFILYMWDLDDKDIIQTFSIKTFFLPNLYYYG